jgi:A/G-specific adenine glycosylase
MGVSEILVNWYNANKRELPWRNAHLAYPIWLSEIILQQTRVNQGLEYYKSFVRRFPRIEDLAKAPLDEVLKLWQGLGYYTRARNLHITAQIITNEHNGNFPSTYDELIKLSGIGPYTAAAIASIAFNEPVALVDGNVFRVLSRLYGIKTPIDTSAGKATFKNLAEKIIDRKNPGTHNQALMEFGALVCLPRNPGCDQCVLASICKANKQGIVDILPVKEGKRKIRTRYFHYLFIRSGDKTYLHKRVHQDIWNSLYEFPLIETEIPESLPKLKTLPPWSDFIINKSFVPDGPITHKHLLTHQTLFCSFYYLNLPDEAPIPVSDFIPVSLKKLHKFAVPKIIDRYLEDLKREGIL